MRGGPEDDATRQAPISTSRDHSSPPYGPSLPDLTVRPAGGGSSTPTPKPADETADTGQTTGTGHHEYPHHKQKPQVTASES